MNFSQSNNINMSDKIQDLKNERERLEDAYEKTRQAWNNDTEPYENRSYLSDRLNEIRVEQELLEQDIDEARLDEKNKA